MNIKHRVYNFKKQKVKEFVAKKIDQDDIQSLFIKNHQQLFYSVKFLNVGHNGHFILKNIHSLACDHGFENHVYYQNISLVHNLWCINLLMLLQKNFEIRSLIRQCDAIRSDFAERMNMKTTFLTKNM